MPLVVRAQVVDIRSDAPTSADRFFVDTNAWYWLVYNRASQNPAQPQPYQIQHYPSYLKHALSGQSALYCCALTFSELAHNIEKTEREIYGNQANRIIHPKKFRHDYPQQRRRIVTLINDAWEDILAMSTLLDMTLDSAVTESARKLFPSLSLDGYDLFMVEAMRGSDIKQIVTDDGDYATVPGLVVFTANPRVIQAAQAARSLLTR
jgi:predicted nucleic acid-binding protein